MWWCTHGACLSHLGDWDRRSFEPQELDASLGNRIKSCFLKQTNKKPNYVLQDFLDTKSRRQKLSYNDKKKTVVTWDSKRKELQRAENTLEVTDTFISLIEVRVCRCTPAATHTRGCSAACMRPWASFPTPKNETEQKFIKLHVWIKVVYHLSMIVQ